MVYILVANNRIYPPTGYYHLTALVARLEHRYLHTLQLHLSSPSKRQFIQQTLLGTTKVDHSQQQQSPTIIVCDFIHNF